MNKIAKRKLREVLNTSLTSNKYHDVYVNGERYTCYHGRVASVVSRGHIIKTDLYQLSVQIYQ